MKIYELDHDDSLFDSLDDFKVLMSDKSLLSSSSIGKKRSNTPRTNILRTPDGFRIDIAIPGFSRSDFNIMYEDNKITVSVDVEDANLLSDYVSREFNFNRFKKTWNLKTTTNSEQIDALYNSGILSINIPVISGSTKKKIIQVS